jgi:hypothetical protein
MKLLLVKSQQANLIEIGSLGYESISDAENLNNLLNELKMSIQKAGKSASPKEEIIFALRKQLTHEQFQSANNLSFRNHINDFISNTCKSFCSIHLSEEDLRVLWI